MSNTRHAAEGEPSRQERFMSSTAYVRGLMANLVARRCELLDAAPDRELIWFLQLLSHREGGLAAFTRELLGRYPERITTKAMQRLGIKRGQVCDAEQVREIRKDMPRNGWGSLFPLRDDPRLRSLAEYADEALMDIDDESGGEMRRQREAAKRESEAKIPDSYPAAAFFERCEEATTGLLGFVEELCLNPEQPISSPWYFPTLIETLREFQAAWITERSAGLVTTEIGRQVKEALDYALETGCMVLVDGQARTGKTTATLQWCEQHPGRARYVQVPSSKDESGFYRAIARSLGVSINLNSKAVELRNRIEDTLQGSRLMVVFDEAHYLWPQGTSRGALPDRLNWIMTALVNKGVPVGLVTTPQFIRSQKRVEQESSWTSEQFIGRIGLYQRLPDTLDEKDLAAVARVRLPEGDDKATALLVAYARSSAKYLAGIDAVVSRARYLATKTGRDKVTRADVAAAIQEGVIPSDNALSAALADVGKGRGSGRRLAASPMPSPCIAMADAAPAPLATFPRAVQPGQPGTPGNRPGSSPRAVAMPPGRVSPDAPAPASGEAAGRHPFASEEDAASLEDAATPCESVGRNRLPALAPVAE